MVVDGVDGEDDDDGEMEWSLFSEEEDEVVVGVDVGVEIGVEVDDDVD